MHHPQPAENAPPLRSRRNTLGWCVASVLFFITLVLFSPTLHYGFIALDDADYVVENSHLRNFNNETIRWAFTHFYSSNWHPLTWLSHALDRALWGLEPAGHHAANILLHSANAVLLFLVLFNTTAALWRSSCVAALFAWHPLHVESVAWISERKDVLSCFLGLLTLLAYLRYARRPGWRRYLVVLVAFIAGLLSKPMLVTFPWVLLLMDVWPLGRIRFDNTDTARRTFCRLLWEKLPLLLLSAGSCVVTFLAQNKSGAVSSLEQLSFSARLASASANYLWYLGKIFYPIDLAIFYPYRATSVALAVFAAAVLLALTVLAIAAIRQRPFWTLGWLWFIGTLVPVVGLVQVGGQAVADRYTYIPSIGLFICAIWGVTAAFRDHRVILAAGIALSLAFCLLGTNRQIRHWRDGQTLFTHALAVTGENAFVHRLLADTLLRAGTPDKAIPHYQASLRADQNDADAHNNFGAALRQIGRTNEAISHFQEALRLRPEFAQAEDGLATAFFQQGNFASAANHYEAAIRLDPNFATACNNLAWLRATCADPQLRNGPEAVRRAQRALDLDGAESISTLDTLAAALAENGQYAAGVAMARRAQHLALNSGQNRQADEIAERIALYRQSLPYHPDR